MRASVGKGDSAQGYFTASLKGTPATDAQRFLAISEHPHSRATVFRRYGLNSDGEQLMSREVNMPVFDGCASRVLPKKVVALPVLRGPDGSGHETAATVRADIA